MLHRLDCSYAFNMTVIDGIDKLGDIAIDSVRKEMQQICEKDVWEGVLINSLTPLQRNNIMTSSMFLKDKYTAEGKFDISDCGSISSHKIRGKSGPAVHSVAMRWFLRGWAILYGNVVSKRESL